MERIAGWCLGAVTLCALGVIGVFRFIPDAGRYLRMKSM
jgi:hypothetical protein